MQRHTGFSLIELLVAMAIVAVLTSLAVPVIETQGRRQKEKELRQALWQIREAVDRYKRNVDEGLIQTGLTASGYPSSLQILVEGVANQRDPERKRILFLRRIPQDPFNKFQPKDSPPWGLRSYASEASDPKSGDDVYDIYSLSKERALDGTEYRAW